MKHMFECVMLGTGKKRTVTKADFLLFAVILASAVLLLFFWQAVRIKGTYATVSYDGSFVTQIPLAQKSTTYYLFVGKHFFTFKEEEWQERENALSENEENSYNAFVCRDGQIQMIRSNCPDLICVHHKPISRTGENIICLPHRVVIEITDSDGQKLDGVIY